MKNMNMSFLFNMNKIFFSPRAPLANWPPSHIPKVTDTVEKVGPLCLPKVKHLHLKTEQNWVASSGKLAYSIIK